MSPIIWSIAGSDSSAGAGIQADSKTIHALGGYACTIPTALTAQNTRGVFHIEPVSLEAIQAQWRALEDDLPPNAVKLGMLGSKAVANMIASRLLHISAPIVYDPVMRSSNGQSLLEDGALPIIRERLLPHVTVLTPNWAEAEALSGLRIETVDDIPTAARALLNLGIRHVLITGGDADGSTALDYWTDGTRAFWLSSPRQATRHTHGTGCTLSSTIATALALGYTVPDAIVLAKGYINQALAMPPEVGSGHGPLGYASWPQALPVESTRPSWLPSVSGLLTRLQRTPVFPDCGPEPLGFYPIVNRAHELEKLLLLGVSTVQLRIKDLEGEALSREIADAAALARRVNARLFVNDYWELALQHNAYGVHLGQSDLMDADADRLAATGLRLGISTHCYEEVARALAVNPSYIAIGPIYATTTKAMPFAPQGLEALRHWRALLPRTPLVAIGGMFLENAPEVLNTGVDGIAVVRDLSQAENIVQRVAQWQALWRKARDVNAVQEFSLTPAALPVTVL